MPLAIDVLPAGQRDSRPVADTLLLSYEQRSSPGGSFIALRGTQVEIALKTSIHLRTDDCLVLEDGRLIEIVAQPERLLEVRTANVAELARLAWMLGDRHIPVAITERRLRVRHDDATEALLRGQSAKIAEIEAPFEPEGGAYAHATHDHDHAHGHAHHPRHGHSHDAS